MKHTLLLALFFGLAGCATPKTKTSAQWESRFGQLQRNKHLEGVWAAKADLGRGVLAYEDIQCEEEEGWRILWCYRKLLKERYDIEYRIICPSPIPAAVGRMEGYQSVVRPILATKLGSDWDKRIFAEAKAYYRAHWPKVAHVYKQDRDAGAW